MFSDHSLVGLGKHLFVGFLFCFVSLLIYFLNSLQGCFISFNSMHFFNYRHKLWSNTQTHAHIIWKRWSNFLISGSIFKLKLFNHTHQHKEVEEGSSIPFYKKKAYELWIHSNHHSPDPVWHECIIYWNNLIWFSTQFYNWNFFNGLNNKRSCDYRREEKCVCRRITLKCRKRKINSMYWNAKISTENNHFDVFFHVICIKKNLFYSFLDNRHFLN